MGRNIEIKARCHDLNTFEDQLKRLAVQFEGEDAQTDTFFTVPEGRLKLRESQLYGNFLIPYVRSDQKGPRPADYSLIPLEDVEKVKGLLSSILGVKGFLRKIRRIYLYENVRIHIDQVEDLGTFIELEAVVSKSDDEGVSRNKIDRLLEYFNIEDDDLIAKAYIELKGI